jgi:hypothetical protein
MKYDLSWNDESGSIEVRFPYDMVQDLPELDDDTPIVQWMREDLGIESKFDGNYLHHFGFDVGLYQELQDGIVTHSARLPCYTMATCDNCDGNGKRDPVFGDEDCIICEGTGDMRVIQWDKLLIMRANLKLLFEALNAWEYSSGIAAEQPDMAINLSVIKPGMEASNMSVPFCDGLCQWLVAISENKWTMLDEVVTAMTRAWDIMSKGRDYDKYYIRAFCEQGRLIMDVPGNATGIYMGTGSFGAGYGTMYSHNMDTGLQQLSILAGLAKLHDLYRKATTDIGIELMIDKEDK